MNQVGSENDLATFFTEAPKINPNAPIIKRVICGVRAEELEDPLMRNIRYLGELIGEIAEGKAMEKILRS